MTNPLPNVGKGFALEPKPAQAGFVDADHPGANSYRQHSRADWPVVRYHYSFTSRRQVRITATAKKMAAQTAVTSSVWPPLTGTNGGVNERLPTSAARAGSTFVAMMFRFGPSKSPLATDQKLLPVILVARNKKSVAKFSAGNQTMPAVRPKASERPSTATAAASRIAAPK